MRRLAPVLLIAGLSLALAQRGEVLSGDQQSTVGKIQVDSLKANLSFLSSDLLEGRATPSRGLDIAAEFIASRFRGAGLEPGGDDGYFQTSEATLRSDGSKHKVRNVVGILRGTDPKLKGTCIVVSAHYDHIGMRRQGEGDLIFNGANDDGSGTVGVIELANAMKGLKPKRSIVFLTYYGEESGGQGSRYYANNPVFPLDKTIANVNLEHIGRTDDSEGARVSELSMTGFDYSDLGAMMNASGQKVGVKVTKHARNSDAFFNRSDNATLAGFGVPAHTVCTAFIFPDYHAVGDHWDKIHYDNMAKVLKGVAVGLLDLANSEKEPRWNEANPKTAAYVKAWKARRSG